MNDFFGLKFQEVLPLYQGYKLALGVGFSYQACLSRPYVRFFDDVVTRSARDLPQLSRQLGSAHAHFLPDLTFALPFPPPGEPGTQRKSVGFFLVDSLRKQRGFLFALCSLASWIVTLGYEVELFPMCADTGGDDDREINRRVWETLEHTGKIKTHPQLGLEDFLARIRGLSFAVCVRFHAHIFCARLGVPILSLPITRKVELLLEEGPSQGMVAVPILRNNYLPVSFDLERAKEEFLALEREREERREALLFWAGQQEKINQGNLKPARLVLNGRKRQVGPSRATLIEPEEIYEKYLKKILRLGLNPLSDKLSELRAEAGGEEIISQLAEELCYDLTLDPANDYLYGTKVNLAEKTGSLREMIYWIHQQEQGKKEEKKLNFDYMKQDSFRGLHRSGWQFAIDGVSALGGAHGILCDTYLDRTFGWACRILQQDGILPYTNRWVGFFHHTFEREFGPLNNLGRVFAEPSFLASLPLCQGIFVLTEYLASQVREALEKIGWSIPVCSLHHPTEFPSEKFSPLKFKENVDKKLINVGAWYRNPVTIHTVPAGLLRPASLRGKRMASNFPPEKMRARLGPEGKIETVESNIWARYWAKLLNEGRGGDAESPGIARVREEVERNADGETDLLQLDSVKEFVQRVEVLETLDDKSYDRLLTENVVFLDLVDASAANTLVECIVRKTPLVVRRIPPVEEALGKDYPLFWQRREEIPSLLQEEKILAAHEYILGLDDSLYRLENFYREMVESEILKSLSL